MDSSPTKQDRSVSKKADFVSVIVPVYNGADIIETLLNALSEQTFPRECFEILIVDNASTDETPAIVEAFACRNSTLSLRLLTEHEHRGSYAARNKGVSAAKGSILAFTDADCRPAPEWIATGVMSLRESGVEQVAGAIEFEFAHDPPNSWEHLDCMMHLRQDHYAQMGFGATANLFVLADALAEVNGFRSDLQSGGDCEFGQRMKAAGFRINYCRDAVVRHPARATYKELAFKIRRVAAGMEVLSREGVYFKPLSLRALLPLRRAPISLLGLEAKFLRRTSTLLLINYFHYLRVGTRLAVRYRQLRGVG